MGSVHVQERQRIHISLCTGLGKDRLQQHPGVDFSSLVLRTGLCFTELITPSLLGQEEKKKKRKKVYWSNRLLCKSCSLLTTLIYLLLYILNFASHNPYIAFALQYVHSFQSVSRSVLCTWLQSPRNMVLQVLLLFQPSVVRLNLKNLQSLHEFL